MRYPVRRLFPLRAIGKGMCLMDRDRFVAVVEAAPVGFALKSARERRQLTMGFARFLNSVQFPMQILIRTDVMRLDEYLFTLKAQEEQLEAHLRPALGDYLHFLNQSSHLEHLLWRRFYIVLCWQGTDSRTRPLKRGDVLWDEAEQELARRQAMLVEGLRSLSVAVARLATPDLYRFVFATLNMREASGEVRCSWHRGSYLTR